MKKVFLYLAAFVALLLLAAGAAVALLDVNQFRGTIQSQLEKRLGRSVKLGSMSLKLLPPSIGVADVTIGEAPQFGAAAGSRPFAQVKQMQVRVGLMPLLHRAVEVDSLRVVAPVVELIHGRDGAWNFESLGREGGAPAPEGGKGGGANTLSITDFTLEDGTIAITELRGAAPSRSVYDHISFHLENFAPGKKFAATASVNLPGGGKQDLSLRATGGPVNLNAAAATDFDGEITLAGVSTAALRAFLKSNVKGQPDLTLNGKQTVASHNGVLTAKGSLSVADPRLREPLRITYDARQDSATQVITVGSLAATLGGVSINGRGTVNTKDSPAVLDADIHTGNAAIEDLLRLAQSFGAAEGITGTGTVLADLHLKGPASDPVYGGTASITKASLKVPSLNKPVQIDSAGLHFSENQVTLDNLAAALGGTHLHGSATVRNLAHPVVSFNAEADRLDLAELSQLTGGSGGAGPSSTGAKHSSSSSSGGALPVTGSGMLSAATVTYNQVVLTSVKATCTLESNMIRLDPLTANLFGGQQTGAISVDLRGGKPKVVFDSKLSGVDANQLLSSTTSVKQFLFGTLAGGAGVQFAPVAGGDPARGLNGTLQMNLTNGKLAGVNLLNEAASISKLLGFVNQAATFTNIVKLSGNVNIKDGVASTDDLALEFDGGALTASGTADLADQKLNMRVTTVLGKEQAQRFGSGQIGGLMNTVLANAKGELVVPAVVSGTFAKPVFTPDSARLAKMKLDNLLPTKDNPKAFISGIKGMVDQLKGKKPGETGAAPPAAAGQPAGAVEQQPQQAQQPQKPAEKAVEAAKPVLDIFNALRNKKKDQQQPPPQQQTPAEQKK
jgi:uncharacterized protein involved in outer membrane biogenesis